MNTILSIMKPIVQKVSFYPFSYHSLPKQGMFAIVRYNIIRHKWITLERKYGVKSDIEDYVRELNEDCGIITEEFIVGYTE